MVAKDALYGPCLRDIIELGACSVRIDIIDFVGRDAGILDRHFHRFRAAGAIFAGGGYMVAVIGSAVSEHFGINFRAAFFSVFVFLKNQYPRAFGKHKAVTVFIERPRSSCWLVVARAE